MISQGENEPLCRAGPGTPMGNLFRCIWLPAALCRELREPGCSPPCARILSEDLIAFREADDKVGLLGRYWPHRGASLFFGRNEQGGLGRVHHGWKFDVTGACVDMPNEPAGCSFKYKIRQRKETERGRALEPVLPKRCFTKSRRNTELDSPSPYDMGALVTSLPPTLRGLPV